MNVKIPVNVEIIDALRKQYADIVAKEVVRINDPANFDKVPKIVSEIQDNLNGLAKHIYDKHGRIIIRVGPGDYDYLDITSPRVKISQTKAMVYFMETDRKGKPAQNPAELEK
jgi:hypothetical protein